MKKPKAFYCYLDDKKTINMLSDEQAGKLWKSLYDFSDEGIVTDYDDDLSLKLLFSMMTSQIERDFEKYQRQCENGIKGGAPEGNQNAKKDD